MAALRGASAAILVVDDDADFRVLMARLLGRLGYQIKQAESGAQALAMSAEGELALVLLDVHMPDISGYEICRELRETFGDELPIMFISGARTESYDRVGGLLLGADDYLVKPFAPDELLARVRRLLARSWHSDNGVKVDLTVRELQVLGLLAGGLSQCDIACELVISEKTVATHIQHILAKLGVHSRAEAVAFAHRHRLSAPAPRAARAATYN